MKKTLLVISSILVLSFSAMAQDFFPGWYVGVKGGATMSVGESEWTNLLSPSAAVSAGYQFSPVFGLRGELSGWQAKGALSTTNYVYKFNDAQLAVDGTFDLASLFAGYKERTFNPYVLVGVGGNARFNNDDLLANKAGLPAENHLWEGSVIGLVGRAGAGVDIRLSDAVAIAVEVVENMHSDKFNSKVGDALDHQIDAQVGLKFNFGAAKKKAAAAAAAAAAAEAEAARLAAEKAAAEAAAEAAAKAAAEAEAARLAAEKAAAEKAAAERAAAEKAAAERAAARQTTENVLFIIGQTNVRPSEQGKIDNIVALMNKYPEAKVTVSGYADKQTGYAKWNMTLSQRRAEAVKKALVEAGIAEDRITTEYYGSEVNPFSTPAANRVAVCVTR